MSDSSVSIGDEVFQRRAVNAAIHIGLVVMLALWCFNIVEPFILIILWGAIIAVAIYPLFMKFQSLLGGREKLAATLMTLIALAMLITPTVMLSGSVIENTEALVKQLHEGTLTIPPPPDKVQGWPLVGEKLYDGWSLASSNLEEALKQFKPQLVTAGKKALSAAAGTGATILQFIVSIIIAGVFLVYAKSSCNAVVMLAERLMGEQSGRTLAEMAGATIRSVTQGVLGVAVIQAVLAAIGFIVMGVPYAGVWALLILFWAIIQLPTIILLAPIIAYVFAVATTVPAIIFMIWCLLVGLSDNILKPLLLGRGLDLPMLVVLLGAIGGMLLSGLIGLFVGAVVLAVGYKLYIAWLNEGLETVDQVQAET